MPLVKLSFYVRSSITYWIKTCLNMSFCTIYYEYRWLVCDNMYLLVNALCLHISMPWHMNSVVQTSSSSWQGSSNWHTRKWHFHSNFQQMAKSSDTRAVLFHVPQFMFPKKCIYSWMYHVWNFMVKVTLLAAPFWNHPYIMCTGQNATKTSRYS
jgi:hypothetical protein